MNKLDKYLDKIQITEAGYKAKRTSITRVTRQTKIDRAIGALSTKYAKETNDPMYKKMVRFRDKYFKYRELIRKKFGPRVRSRALSGAGISDMLKDKQKSGSTTGKSK